MNNNKHEPRCGLSFSPGLGRAAVQLGFLLATLASSQAFALNLKVQDVGGTAISDYKYIINADNVGTTEQRGPNDPVHPGCSTADPGYPGTCNWTSIAGSKSNAPVMAQGDQSTLSTTATLAECANITDTGCLPAGKYLISVLAAGHKLDGEHFTIPSTGTVTVKMQPAPLPDVTIQAAVFEDITPANSAPDVPAEHGLAGFQGVINDTLGQVTTDFYGNPLCTTYVNNDPNQIDQIGGQCLSKCYVVDNGIDVGTVAPVDSFGRCPTDPAGLKMENGVDVPATAAIEGKVKIPHLGPNRYTLTVLAPSGKNWIQTTTLEGNHDWDAWVMEGATGLDTEFVVAGEPFPGIFFGFVPDNVTVPLPASTPNVSGSGSITGVVESINVYWPPVGGTNVNGTVFGGMNGAKIADPQPWNIAGHPNNAWVTVSDINNADTVIRIAKADATGHFTIDNLPSGPGQVYNVTWWDDSQNYILDLIQVNVDGPTDVGILPLAGWWTPIHGTVFNDTNRNGKRDAGEPGVANYPIAMKRRDNSVMDRGWIGGFTDSQGNYYAENVYPMTQWLTMEAYTDGKYTTGITFQADNQPTETTIHGAGVDVNLLPIIGLSGRLDWGVHSYDATGATGGLDPRNGGIVGTITYDTTRNELNPQYAAAEPWQPSVAGLPVNLYATVPCGTNQGAPCAPGNPSYELAADGSYKKGALINQYISETWERPKGCTARNVDGNALVHTTSSVPGDENVLPLDPNADCLEGPLQGVQFGPMEADQTPTSGSFGASLDGNYGFGDACFVQNGTQLTPGVFDPGTGACTAGSLLPLPARDYLVEVAVPTDAFGKKTYQFTREEDVNIANGDQFVPQVPPPACAGPLHIVDVKNDAGGTDGWTTALNVASIPGGVIVPASTPVDNPTFLDLVPPGSSHSPAPDEGMAKPLCDTKLVRVSNGKSIAPTFFVFTEVPLPGRFWGLLVDNVNVSTDPRSLLYGERPGVPFAPIGIYDYTNRLIHTTESDFNGLFDVLMPSTNRINCPTPSGVCTNLYRFVGNDPGTSPNLNPNWNPQYQTIAAEFEAMPGVVIPADLAPATVGQQVQLPGGQFSAPVSCPINDPTKATSTPELLAVSDPYVNGSGSFTITGQGFGGAGTVSLVNPDTNAETALTVTNWTENSLSVTVGGVNPGAYQLKITRNDTKRSSINSLTFHVLGAGYITSAQVHDIPAFDTLASPHGIQDAINAANAGDLIVIRPGTPSSNVRVNPRGAYFENLVINKPIKLQGVGPGGFQGNTWVPGSILDGSAIQGDTTQATDWRNLVASLNWSGTQTVYEGAVVTVYAPANAFGNTVSTKARIDGFDIRGGDQQGFPNNINVIGGGANGLPRNVVNQAGAIFVNAHANYLQITNNVIQNNGGGYGTLRIGTPNLNAASGTDIPDQHNYNIRIANNRVIANGGANLAGGIGIFSGANNFEVASNDICGNSSVEYGGGMSVYGLSPQGKIHDNRVYLNRSLDEGGGIMIAGTLPANPSELSTGVGGVDIYSNIIQANLSGDDGGGIRFLMSASKTGNNPDANGFDKSRVYNNIIVNNVSPHEGGGISFDDAANVDVYNNTVMSNLTTATAVTSNGFAAPAGLATAGNSALLQAAGAPPAFEPSNFINNIFWDNRAGSRSAAAPYVTGIGLNGDAINYWDVGAADGSATLAPLYSILQQSAYLYGGSNNTTSDPLVVSPYNVSINILPWRTNPQFTGSTLVALDLPPNQAGDYHIKATSPAKNAGTNAGASSTDIDNDVRPAEGTTDIGADEIAGAPLTTDLSITKTDGATTAFRGDNITYTIVVSNNGPAAVTGARVVDTLPTGLIARAGQTAITWTCTASAGANCGVASGNGSINGVVNLPANGSVTYTVSARVNANATLGAGALSNTASVSAPVGVTDTNSGNNSATDVDDVANGVSLSITKTDGVASVHAGNVVTYTIIATNNATTGTAVNAIIADTVPVLTNVTYTCTSGALRCLANSSGTGNAINATVNLGVGNATRNATIRVTGTVPINTPAGTMANTATVTGPAGTVDRIPADNTATDTDAITPPPAFPTLVTLDTFNRNIANTLGGSWTQLVASNNAGIHVLGNQAQCGGLLCVLGSNNAYWNVPNTGFGNKQAASFTFANNVAVTSGSGLILKASGNLTAGIYPNAIRVRYSTGNVTVETTNNGLTYTTAGTLPSTFSLNNRLTALANADGSVDVWRTAGTANTYLGNVATSAAFAGGGKIGIYLPNNAAVDDFAGGNVP